MYFRNFLSFISISFVFFLISFTQYGCEKGFDSLRNVNSDDVDVTSSSLSMEGLPAKVSKTDTISVTVSGENMSGYKYKLDNFDWAEVGNIEQKIEKAGIGAGSHCLSISGKKRDGSWGDITNYFFTVTLFDSLISNINTNNNQFFGKSIAVSQNTFVIGAAGAIHVYRHSNSAWEETKITVSVGSENQAFGHSVAVSEDGNTVVVGSPRYKEGVFTIGAVYIYQNSASGWEETKLIASDEDVREFGMSVSISADGNTVVVGPAAKDIYFFERSDSSWQEKKIRASDGVECLGHRIAISADGNTVVASNNSKETMYIFEKKEGLFGEPKEFTTFDPDDVGVRDFEHSVSISADGGTVVVGAPTDMSMVPNYSGSVYIFEKSGSSWQKIRKKIPKTYNSGSFGKSVSVSADGKTVAVGFKDDNDHGTTTGSVYVYQKSGSSWEETKYIAPDATSQSYFGWDVSVSSDGKTIIAGAPQMDYKGKVYCIYR